jgi:hypothetical protein
LSMYVYSRSMPSEEHEVLAEMFRVRPELALDVLEVLNFPRPEYDDAVVGSGELNDLVPTEFRADRVVTYTVRKKPVFAVIVEVQRRSDERKQFSWPAYVGTLYSRLKCPVLLVVVCPDAEVARWCATPLVIFNRSFFRMAPVAIGPDQVPVVTDMALAETNPELVLLSTILHRDEPDLTLQLRITVAALRKIEEATGVLYYVPILAVLPQAHRIVLEEIVTATGYRNEWALHHEAVGEARGEARALLTILAARKIDVPADVRATIVGCTDVGRLDLWVQRAVTADQVGDLFD